ncbi:MAG: LLM class flavin-dependent oxidoreductase [Actinobacteria bacterium]|nr:LLM class flavin-dependent oxidoreductase [Actinomycetota bacterium]
MMSIRPPAGQQTMRFGLFLNTQCLPKRDPLGSLEELLEQVQEAEDLGFDVVMCGQHFLAHPYGMLAPLPLLSRIAPLGGSMRIAAGIVLATLAHPVALAEEAVTLDILTGGRFVLGMGLGYRDEEFAAFRVPRQRRAKTFEAHVHAVTELLSGRSATLSTHSALLDGAKLSLLPVQEPRPPIWLAANNERAIARAARVADSWLVNPHARLDTLEHQARFYRKELADRGKVCRELPIVREACVADDDAEAIAIAQEFLGPKYATYLSWGQHRALPKDDPLDLEFANLARDRFVVGSPETCADMIADYARRLDTDLLVFRVQWPGLPQHFALRSIRLLGDVVLPELNRKTG